MAPSTVLAHRGLWASPDQQNTIGALVAAAQNGFGLELDLRDYRGELVISHDPPRRRPVAFKKLLETLDELDLYSPPTLALNIKADGLAEKVLRALREGPQDFFCFDMSFPENVRYQELGLPVAIRVSELENSVAETRTNDRFRTVWLDSFYSDWWKGDFDFDDLVDSFDVYVVSPELHGREPLEAWEFLANKSVEGKTFGICTDFPKEVSEWLTPRISNP